MVTLSADTQATDGLSGLLVMVPECDADRVRSAWRHLEECARSRGADDDLRDALAVARILADLHLDTESLCAALLHAPVARGALSLDAVREEFGGRTANLVEGVVRMDTIRDHGLADGDAESRARHTESLRKMLMAMVEDVRVVLVKLAARLQAMRGLRDRPEAERRQVAEETRDIFAPLANRLGIWQLKWELEDLAFRYLEPDTYASIARSLNEKRDERERFIEDIKATLQQELAAEDIKAEISGRPKHIYSIWRKMQRKNRGLEALFDIRAVRLLVDDVNDCYAALGVVHKLWPYLKGEFDDYIANPKDNNYRSLHTAVVGPEGKTLEVQIRTHDMHRQAELGVAAHWRYKEGGSAPAAFDQKIRFLRQILEPAEDGGELLEQIRDDVFEDRVYAVSPKGDVVELPAGATPLDFAYHVHTMVGHRCRGAKVNGRIVPLTYRIATSTCARDVKFSSANLRA